MNRIINETMDITNYSFNIFIPTFIFKNPHFGLLFGYYEILSGQKIVNFNITAVLPYKRCRNTFPYDSLMKADLGISYLGQLKCGKENHDNTVEECAKAIAFNSLLQTIDSQFNFTLFLTPTSTKLHNNNKGKFPFSSNVRIDELYCDGLQVYDYSHVTFVFYDTSNFMASQLLNRYNVDNNRVEFVDFIHRTLKNTAKLYNQIQEKLKPILNKKEKCEKHKLSMSRLVCRYVCGFSSNSRITSSDSESTEFESQETLYKSRHDLSLHSMLFLNKLILLIPRRLTRAFVYFSSQNNLHSFSLQHLYQPKWIIHLQQFFSLFQCFLLKKTTIFAQLQFRWLQLQICYRLFKEIPRKRISLSLCNVISSLALDLFLGNLTMYMLFRYATPSNWFELSLNYANSLVNDVYQLLKVLQSMPVGLKLNRPLNMALSQFFLYHIYLWRSYMVVIMPIFDIIMKAIFYSGIFGFTCILSLLSDLFSLVTIHIYCFYGYACLIYGHQISGISALWRLFRGKKWNQLRSRVDSYSYDNEQLFIGTILFTVLLFLLPTVFMYYLVFLVLRILTLAVKEGLFFFIEYLSSMPLYTLLLWLFNSPVISGRVYFDTLSPFASSHNLDKSAKLDQKIRPFTVDHKKIPNKNFPFMVLLKTERVSLFKIISSRYDAVLQTLQTYRQSSSASQFLWTEFFHCIFAGKLLHQSLSYGLTFSLFILCYLFYLCYYFGLISFNYASTTIDTNIT